MTKVGKMIYEDGWKEGQKKERIIAVVNMLKLNIDEQKILGMYSKEDLNAAKEVISEEKLTQ